MIKADCIICKIVCLTVLLIATASEADINPVADNTSMFEQAIQLQRSYPLETLTIEKFPICLQYTCKQLKYVSIDPKEWMALIHPLAAKPANPAMERALLAEVISGIETYVNRIVGTSYDLGGTFPAKKKGVQLRSLQLDCVDEAFNMYVYFGLLYNSGQMRWHTPGDWVHRGWLLDGKYPHTAYTLYEQSSSKQYVLDSWFLDSGRPPFILSLDVWESGWVPKSQ